MVRTDGLTICYKDISICGFQGGGTLVLYRVFATRDQLLKYSINHTIISLYNRNITQANSDL
jgi:hypothetical protein